MLFGRTGRLLFVLRRGHRLVRDYVFVGDSLAVFIADDFARRVTRSVRAAKDPLHAIFTKPSFFRTSDWRTLQSGGRDRKYAKAANSSALSRRSLLIALGRIV